MSDTDKKVLGYYMREKKLKSFRFVEEFIPVAEARGYQVIPYDAVDPNQHVDIVLTKLTEDFGIAENDEHCRQLIERFQEVENRNVLVVDPVEAQRVVSDRQLLSQTLDAVDTFDDRLQNPRYRILKSPDTLESDLADSNIHFPVIMKTIRASGSLDAHAMGIIFTLDQMKEHIQYPAFVQEYFNHHATIYKVSVIGTYIHCDKKASTKDFKLEDNPEPVFFNSQNMKDITDQETYKTQPDLSEDDCMHVAKSLSLTLGLHMYGFDVIRCNKSGKLVVIDVNFFPSFRAVPDVNNKIMDLFDTLTQK